MIVLLLLPILLFSKILVVNSYDKYDQCGIPQLKGFLSTMYKANYKPYDFDIYFLDVRKSSKKVVLKKVRKILKKINNYTSVVVFDDAAFKLIGIPASHKKRVIFSGLNVPFSFYKKHFKLNPKNIGGVYEKLYIKEVLNTFNLIKPINKIALFHSKGMGKILKKQIMMELNNSNYLNKINFIKVNTISQLKKLSEQVNNNKNITLFMPLALSLKCKNKKIPLYKFKDIYLKIKKPDISLNKSFVHLGFLGFGGVDFYEMGVKAGKIFLSKKNIIENAPKYYLFINAKRARDINFTLPKWFMIKYIKEIIW